MKIHYLLPLLLVLLPSCTSIKVRPLESSQNISSICIQNNPRVRVKKFINILRNEIEDHGIMTELYNGSRPDYCNAFLKYTALRSWDFIPYLSHAELEIFDNRGESIAYAMYHLRGKGGLDLTKWKSVDSKMKPVIEQLLSNYSKNEPLPHSQRFSGVANNETKRDNSNYEQIEQLKKLYDDGVLSESEYIKKKEEILKRI